MTTAVRLSPFSKIGALGPYVLSALFFVSGLFIVFAPLPLAILFFRHGRSRAWFAVATNTALVAAAAGVLSGVFFFVAIGVMVLTLCEGLARAKSVERAVGTSLVTAFFVGIVLILGFSAFKGTNPIHALAHQANTAVEGFIDSVGMESLKSSGMVSEDSAITLTREDWKKELLWELPSALIIMALVLVWSTSVFVLRLNPGGIRERLGLDPLWTRHWKAPEHLIWPTIAAAGVMAFAHGPADELARSGFKVLMAIYAIQGLSILSFLFDLWNLQGLIRGMALLVVLVLMMPIVLSLGVFDLWFDFRAKFRQT